MKLTVVDKESHSSNGNAEWAGPCSLLPFPSPGCYPGHPGSVKQHFVTVSGSIFNVEHWNL